MKQHFLVLILTLCVVAATYTDLDAYVTAPDSSYKWERVSSFAGVGYTVNILKLTSQTWLSSPRVSMPVWEHWLVVAIPDQVDHNTAMLYIGEGSNPLGTPPTDITGIPELALFEPVLALNSVWAALYQIPNQKISFRDDPVPGFEREEDQLIAFTWWDYVHNFDSSILARFPMVKGAVKAMDAVQEFVAEETAEGRTDAQIDDFVVIGASKRGWTTWLTAIDDRVIGIIPIVIDVLNLIPSLNHHFRSYGFFSFAIGDYAAIGYNGFLNTRENKRLMKIIDPFSYKDRFTLPKYIINSAGDEFFSPTSSQFYYNRLRGPKSLRYVPNSRHGSAGPLAIESIITWYNALINHIRLPKVVSWIKRRTGRIYAVASVVPTKVLMWTAYNENARVFRGFPEAIPWTSTPILPLTPSGQIYKGVPDTPATGFRAAFLELHFNVGGTEFVQTSQVAVVPDVLPFGSCSDSLCACKDACTAIPPLG